MRTAEDHAVRGPRLGVEIFEVAAQDRLSDRAAVPAFFRQRNQEFPDAQVMTEFVQQYYATGTLIPDEVLIPFKVDDQSLLAEWLSASRGRKVRLIPPRKGTRARLVELANKNAAASAASRLSGEEDAALGLEKLKQRLGMDRVPRRIECYDIAHIQGTSTVASMVVFVDGKAERSLYRKFSIKSASNDDFAAMYEVLTRRFRRAREGADPAWQLPDLVVVDGGKGQLSTALAALADLGFETGTRGVFVVGLAKERPASGTSERQAKAKEGVLPDRVFLPRAKDPIRLRANTRELFLLTRLRDEAHRFANAFHRRRRTGAMLRSALDDIPGIGAKRRKSLLKHLGSLKAIKAATVEELARVPSMNEPAARAVRRFFDQAEQRPRK